MGRFRKSTHARSEFTDGWHRFEHWYRDNTVYFITARTRDGFPAFQSEEAKQVFWDRFTQWTNYFGFVPWVTTLLFNHYHTLGFLRIGDNLGSMMQRIHGSVAKLVNDVLPERRAQFWRVENQNDYFDGCIRHDLQCRRAYRYTHLQAVRAGLVKRAEDYSHTRVDIDLEVGICRALELRAFLPHVEYTRYVKNRRHGMRR
jgi:hypothetical protein